MIKKTVFEDEIVAGMQQQLNKQASKINTDNLEEAVEYLKSAADIFDDLGLTKNADEIFSILSKIANVTEDKHTKNLTSEKMTSNLKEHGTVFNLLDDDKSRKHFLDTVVFDDVLSVSDHEETEDFEDEID